MIQSQIEIIEQAIIFLQSVDGKDYSQVITPKFESSAGSHIRHIIDHYESIRNGFISGEVDYNIRSRGASVEKNPQLAIQKLTFLSNWISELTATDINRKITLTTEVSIIRKEIVSIESNIARELIFAGSHAIHHYAIISQIIKNQIKSDKSYTPYNFGIAPATATFLRNTTEQVESVNSKPTESV
ncbi:MAG: hypothetical protein COB38_05485 [Gammaproteobacteria bacterium]|nr:MAG: hypothetical protein COB38_05485 [Gammaproteobacteria bacterium]